MQNFINKIYLLSRVELLRLKGVSKEYGKHLVLNNINFSVEEEDIYGIIGKSGSGKSTLLNLIVGFLEPSEGELVYYTATGKPKKFKNHAFRIKKKIGFNPQHLSFYPKLTVKENLLHFGQVYRIKKGVLIDNAKNLLKFTGLFDYRNVLAEDLSGGMQKRLDIACSLVHKPKVLVLDEPITDLDPLLKADVLDLIKEVNRQGVTVVIASHDLEDVEQICNKVAIVHKGNIHEEGLLEDIRKPFLQKDSLISLKGGKHHNALLEFSKTLPVSKIVDRGTHLVLETKQSHQTVTDLMKFIEDNGLSLNQVEIAQPSLKTIFESIVKEKN